MNNKKIVRNCNNIFEIAVLEEIKRSSVIHFRDRHTISSICYRRNEVSFARYSYRYNINATVSHGGSKATSQNSRGTRKKKRNSGANRIICREITIVVRRRVK